MTIRSPAKLGALSHRSLPRPQIGPECGSNPDRACQTRAQDDVVHVAAPACGCSANPLNISSREDRCFFLRCYRKPRTISICRGEPTVSIRSQTAPAKDPTPRSGVEQPEAVRDSREETRHEPADARRRENLPPLFPGIRRRSHLEPLLKSG